MIDMNHLTYRLRSALRPALALVTLVLLLCAAPAGADWLARGTGVAGAGHALKETLEENAGLFDRMVSAFIDGDDETVSELVGEVGKTPGKLIRRAFPVLEAPQAIATRLKSARQKVEYFVGGVGETIADARSALAVDRDERDSNWAAALLDKEKPLPTPAETAFTTPRYESARAVMAALTGKDKSEQTDKTPTDESAFAWDFEEWVIAKQEAKPHCYGVVDLKALPADCFGAETAEEPAASPAAANKAEDLPQTGGFDWDSDDWSADTGWAGWDRSDDRYSDADRDAARVGVFAARCWGVYEVSKRHGLYELMRERMQRNECPNEETNQVSSDGSQSEYATALADVIENDFYKSCRCRLPGRTERPGSEGSRAATVGGRGAPASGAVGSRGTRTLGPSGRGRT